MKSPPVIELVRRRDGKLYPAVLRTPAEHRQVVALIHNMRCVDRLSYPAIRAALLERHAIRRSLGMIWRDANEFRCPNCGSKPAEAPAAVPRPVPVPAGTPQPTLGPPPQPRTASPPRPRTRPGVYPWR